MKATEQYFPVVLFIMMYKVVSTLESVDVTIKYGHSNESYRAATDQCFPVVLSIMLCKLCRVRERNVLKRITRMTV